MCQHCTAHFLRSGSQEEDVTSVRVTCGPCGPMSPALSGFIAHGSDRDRRSLAALTLCPVSVDLCDDRASVPAPASDPCTS